MRRREAEGSGHGRECMVRQACKRISAQGNKVLPLK